MTTISTAHFLTTLKLGKGAAESTSVYPIFNHFCFCETYVYTYNDIWAVLVWIDTPLRVALRADILLGVLPTLEEEVEFKLGKDVVRLTSGTVKLSLASLPEEAMLFDPPEVTSWPMKVKLTEAIMAGLARCVQTVSADSHHREFTGIAFVAEKNKLTLYSSDDTRISRFEAGECAGNGEWLVPVRGCSQLLELWNGLKETGTELEAYLFFNEKWATMETEKARVYCKLMPEAPPDYRATIKRIAPKNALWSTVPAELIKAAARAEVLVAKDLGAGLCLTLEDEVLDARLQEGSRVSYGKFEEQFPMPGVKGKIKLVIEIVRLNQSLQGAKEIMLSAQCLGLTVGDYTCWISPFADQAAE